MKKRPKRISPERRKHPGDACEKQQSSKHSEKNSRGKRKAFSIQLHIERKIMSLGSRWILKIKSLRKKNFQTI